MYSPSGCTIDLWTKIPGINQENDGFWEHPFDNSAFNFKFSGTTGKWMNAHYYRVLMGCENTGGVDNNINASAVIADRSSDFVRGMLMGFSRDPKMYYQEGTVQSSENDFDIRLNYGYFARSVELGSTAASMFTEPAGTALVWTVSGMDYKASPSGTGYVNAAQNNISGIEMTYAGDGVPTSAHNTEYVLLTTPAAVAFREPSGTFTLDIERGANARNPMGVASSCFFIAPTQSYNSSAVGFVKSGSCSTEDEQLLRFTVPLNQVVSSVALSSVASEYLHLSIVFDPNTDAIQLYVDGVLLQEGLISTTFNVSPGEMPQVPSLISPSSLTTSSFYYNSTSVSAGGEALSKGIFNKGPNTNGFFTPWIVGGGWSDGRPISNDTSSGGFMSPGDGVISSYNGYLGSFKVYCKALNSNEVKDNFESQKVFFKNI